ncbi:MAG: DUF4350 domain-containing protein [Peptococcaceae bacterium]|jgi:hypothetical protein|nr:DUF4350 domain-containing protein [Peptococcaceae bacterium]
MLTLWFKQPKHRFLSAIGLLLFLLGIACFAFIPARATPYPAYLTDSPAPTGAKAFYTYLHSAHPHTGVWRKPVQALPGHAGQLMIILEPATPPIEDEAQYWRAWLEQGNHLLLLTEKASGFLDISFAITAEAENAVETAGTPMMINGFSALNGTYTVLANKARLAARPEDQVLLQDEHGVIALTRPYGQGDLTVLTTPQWLTNEHILSAEHLPLLLAILNHLPVETIWFNEYFHGQLSLLALLGLYPKWYIIALIQGALCLLIIIWSRMRRFGPLRLPRVWTVRFGDERIRALASWYEKSAFYRESLRIQDQYLRQLMRERWNLALKADDPEIVEQARRRVRALALSEWLSYWQARRELESAGKLSARRYLQWSQRYAFMQKEVEQR